MSYKLVSVGNKFIKPIGLYTGENTAYKFIEAILEEYEYCKKVLKKHFNENLITTENKEKKFQLKGAGYVKNSLKVKK